MPTDELEERSSGPRVVSWITAVVVVLAISLEVFHATGLLNVIPLSPEHATEAILVACFTLCFTLREQFGKNEEGAEKLRQKVVQLTRQVHASADISRFSDQHQFHSHWKHIRESYSTLTLVGVPPTNFREEFRKLFDKKKRCSLYLDVGVDTQALAREFLQLSMQADNETFKLYDVSFPLGSFWILGQDHTGTGLEALICFPPINELSADGLHLADRSAHAFSATVLPALKGKTVAGEKTGPARIYTESQVDMVVDRKGTLYRAMLDVELGEPLKGAEAICYDMSRKLETTYHFLDVTHVCSDQSIPILRTDYFADWLKANYQAQDRGVKVRRAFILPNSLRRNPELISVVTEMRNHGLTVFLCDREMMDVRFVEDFSLYDDKHVIYISREGGAWVDENQTRARSSDSIDQIEHYRNIFETLVQRSR